MTRFGSCCDRCGRVYATNNWPAASLCGYCDLERQSATWRPGLVKSATMLQAISS